MISYKNSYICDAFRNLRLFSRLVYFYFGFRLLDGKVLHKGAWVATLLGVQDKFIDNNFYKQRKIKTTSNLIQYSLNVKRWRKHLLWWHRLSKETARGVLSILARRATLGLILYSYEKTILLFLAFITIEKQSKKFAQNQHRYYNSRKSYFFPIFIFLLRSACCHDNSLVLCAIFLIALILRSTCLPNSRTPKKIN